MHIHSRSRSRSISNSSPPSPEKIVKFCGEDSFSLCYMDIAFRVTAHGSLILKDCLQTERRLLIVTCLGRKAMWRVVCRQPCGRKVSAKPILASKTFNRNASLDVRPISGSLGAEIHGVDLHSLQDNTVIDIRQALLDHLVIFFRKQDLDLAAFLSFTAHFGKPVPYPFVKGVAGYPEIIQVLKREIETTNFGGVWHADTTYLEKPPMGSVLLAREVPPYGGDTLFANQYAAYDTLSDGLKKTLDTLRGVSTSAKADASRTREDRVKESGTAAKEDHIVSHPTVRTHPETGRKALYVNVAHTERFEGWTTAESEPLLQYLFKHQIKPEFTCRFRWEKDSIAFWDNRCAQHNPINDYHGFRRSMHRITLAGDKPV